MKKRISVILIAAMLTVLLAITLSACGGSDTPQKLGTPSVTLTDGVASWAADANADKFEISVDGNLSYVENTVTSKNLTNGQSFKIRAVGDGVKFTTSDWSNTVTYTASGQSTPAKLITPTVTVSASGVASWGAVANASGYVYKIDNGSEIPTELLSVQLSAGQSISVKAVGDGVNYTDSDFSAAKTFTQSGAVTTAPTYLRIVASLEEPSSALTLLTSGRHASACGTGTTLEEALRAYYSDGANSLGDTAPTATDYGIYSQIGSTVYIQIWLDNPDQNTILSMKLNGVKYQTGGGLESFFIQSANSYLNCVYVAVNIPDGSYDEITYEVTEIEYVEGNNINQDGKSVLIDEDNDTVKIGLPHREAMPTVEITNATKTASSITLTLNVNDADGYVSLVGGWLRVIIYDQNNNILAQEKLVGGANTLTFSSLGAETYYNVMAFVLADARDGQGVYAHSLASESYRTESVISVTAESFVLLNASTGKYYPKISVNAQLSDPSFSFKRIEISNWDGTVYSGEFDGSIEIVENILNGQDYTVTVYYENALSQEQSHREHVYVDALYYPWANKILEYGLIDDAVLGFDFGNDKFNIDNVVIRITDENSKQYIAQDVLYLLDNPTAIANLEAEWTSMDRADERFNEVYSQWHRLNGVQHKIDNKFSEVARLEWEAEAAKGIYVFELKLGEDAEFFKGKDNKYYVILKDYQAKRSSDGSMKFVITADVDRNDGEGVEFGRDIGNGFFSINPALSESDYLFVVDDEFYIDEDNVLHLTTNSRNNLGNESARELGYVNQIVLTQGRDIIAVLWSQTKETPTIDEDAWLLAIKNALILGEDIAPIFPLGSLEPISFDLDDIELPIGLAGDFSIRFTYKMYGKTYTGEHPYDMDGSAIDYKVVGKLPQASININTSAVDSYGTFEVVIPPALNGGSWYYYTVEVKDGEGNTVGTYDQNSIWNIQRLSAGYTIKIKLTADPYVDYYEEGEWSEEFVCTPLKLATPSGITQSYTGEGVKISWNWVEGVQKYVYILNGTPMETTETYIDGLANGDTFTVKAVADTASGFADSDYTEQITVLDAREALVAPVVTYDAKSRYLMWNSVANAEYYRIYNVTTGEFIDENIYGTERYVPIGYVYTVFAIPSNTDTHRAGKSEPISTIFQIDTPEITVAEDGTVSFTRYSIGARVTYTYVINGGEEQTTTSYKAVTLAAGDTLKVKASATGYIDSEWSETVTYTGN